jgi:hypothetical protein
MSIPEIPPSQMASSGNVYFCQLQQHFFGCLFGAGDIAMGK